MKKFYLILLVSVLFLNKNFAQINYTFSAVAGTYTPVTGTTITLTQDDKALGYTATDEGYNNSVPIGFSFYYNGSTTAITTLKVNTDGFVALGSNFGANQDGYWYNNLTNGPSRDSSNTMVYTGYKARRAIIAPLWADLDVSAAANLRYKTSGTAPNRVFTLEWADVLWDFNATSAVLSFELILHETTNVIEFQYQSAGTPSTSAQASIGLTATGTGAGKFLSLQDASANPAISKVSENKLINTIPPDGQIYRFTPATPITNDATTYSLFPLGSVAANGDAYSVTSIVANIGTAAINNLPVTLNVSGANTFSQTVTVPTLDSFKAVYVTFTGYTPTATGADTYTLNLPNDQDVTNNSLALPVTATSNIVSTAYNNASVPKGVGIQSSTIEIASRFNVPSTRKIKQVGLYFSSGTYTDLTASPLVGQPFDLTIYDTTGTAGSPGAILYQKTGNVSDSGRIVVTLDSSITVNGGYYISVNQTDTNNIAMGYETETPLRPSTFYINTGSGFNALSSTYKFMVDAIYDNGTSTPVSLLRFSGSKVDKNTNLLKWTTSTEANNSGFDVLKSTDGIKFNKVAIVESKAKNGNSTTAIDYTYTDNAATGTNYYRLNQVDKNGKSVLSEIVVVKEKAIFKMASIYPNPVQSSMVVNISSPEELKATSIITDITGKTVLTNNFTIFAGDNLINHNLSNLKPGSYVINVIAADGSTQTQLFEKK